MMLDAGMDGLHPLQALAAGIDAENLSRNFKGKMAFVGGVDTQQLLVHGTPQQVRDDVRRLRDLLGPNLVVSPSHEAILPMSRWKTCWRWPRRQKSNFGLWNSEFAGPYGRISDLMQKQRAV